MKRKLVAVLVSSLFICAPITAFCKTTDTYISKTAYEACVKYGNEYDISPELLMAIIETESVGKANVQNGYCTGLMQVSSK
jgi:soluble lytic murein transglycosylase-like protein